MHKIYCLFIKGGELTRDEYLELHRRAHGMKRDNQKRIRFRINDVCVTIRTGFKHGAMGTIFGIIFNADLRSPTESDREMQFLVSHRDMQEADEDKVQLGYIPQRALLESQDPTTVALN